MAAITDADAALIVGLTGAAVTYLTNRQVKARRAAKQRIAAEVRELIDSYKEQITYLRAELDRARGTRRAPRNDA